MLQDKTNTYESSRKENIDLKSSKRVSLDIQYINQTFEKTQDFCTEELGDSVDLENLNPSKEETDIQKSICFQENEIQRLSQAYADKYYYQMKFEQYQNLLYQQQQTISKLINEKQDLQLKMDQVGKEQVSSKLVEELQTRYQETLRNNDETQQLLQSVQKQNTELNSEVKFLNNEIDKLNKEVQIQLQNQQTFLRNTVDITEYNELQNDYKQLQIHSDQKEYQLTQTISDLTSQLENSRNQNKNSKSLQEEIVKQMQEIKKQNNYLFEQLAIKEQQIETNFLEQIQDLEERLNQEKQEIQEDYESQLALKEEMIHQAEMQSQELNSQLQGLYSENLQLQNQLDLLNNNYQEDIQKQANLLQQQVGEYKIVINNLENQLFLMNAEIQRRGRSNSKDTNQRFSKLAFKRQSNEMSFNSTPNNFVQSRF
ncbi:hypothetical protein pb186bvf_010358 [Paramecium bursaria]